MHISLSRDSLWYLKHLLLKIGCFIKSFDPLCLLKVALVSNTLFQNWFLTPFIRHGFARAKKAGLPASGPNV